MKKKIWYIRSRMGNKKKSKVIYLVDFHGPFLLNLNFTARWTIDPRKMRLYDNHGEVSRSLEILQTKIDGVKRPEIIEYPKGVEAWIV